MKRPKMTVTMLSRARLLVFVAAIACAGLVASSCTAVESDSKKITAYFADTSGLFVGNDVGILGVPVGTVTEIEPEGNQVRVELEVESKRQIPADAGAVVVARSVATDRYVELTPVYDNGPEMQDNAVIEMTRTQVPVDFDSVLDSINTLARGLTAEPGTSDALGSAIDGAAAALGGKGALIRQTINNVSTAVDGITEQRDDFSATVKSLDVLTGKLVKDKQTINTFIDQVSTAADILNAEKKNFRAALRAIARTVEQLAAFVKENRPALATFLGETAGLLEDTLATRADLSEIMETLPLALQNLTRAERGGKLHVTLPLRNFVTGGGILRVLCNLLAPPEICALGQPIFDAGDYLDEIIKAFLELR